MIKLYKETEIRSINIDRLSGPGIVQVEYCGGEYALCEVLDRENPLKESDFDKLTPMPRYTGKTSEEASKEDERVKEYREVVLNKDPFGEYSGWTLGDIMDDPESADWVERTIKEMKNSYIKDRVKFLKEHQGAR